MTASEAMHWRYATKRMLNKPVPESKLHAIIEAIHLSPSSVGLQPYEVFIISNKQLKDKIAPVAFNQKQITESSHLLVFAAWDKYTDERIDRAIDYLAKEKNLSAEDAEKQKISAKKFLSFSEEAQFHHAAKQSAIALGIALITAAQEGIDASPMEGFNPAALDELLQLKEKGLRSTTLLALGYRDEINDWNLKLKKVRKPLHELITTIK